MKKLRKGASICRLNYADRKFLEKKYASGEDLKTLAALLGVHISTIYRELARGYTNQMDDNGRNGYSAEQAQKAILKKPIKNQEGLVLTNE